MARRDRPLSLEYKREAKPYFLEYKGRYNPLSYEYKASDLSGVSGAALLSVLASPIPGARIRSDRAGAGTYLASRAPRNGVPRTHSGIDIAGAVGTPVGAPFAGTVDRLSATSVMISGWVNELDETTGRTVRARYVGIYRHMTPTPGRDHYVVRAGTQVGTVNHTNVEYPNARGMTPHVHFELYKRINGRDIRLDPTDFISIP